jgi:hypothetical protein
MVSADMNEGNPTLVAAFLCCARVMCWLCFKLLLRAEYVVVVPSCCGCHCGCAAALAALATLGTM